MSQGAQGGYQLVVYSIKEFWIGTQRSNHANRLHIFMPQKGLGFVKV